MGRKKNKFEKLGVNERYIDSGTADSSDKSDKSNKAEGFDVNTQKKGIIERLFSLANGGNSYNQSANRGSSSFKYKKAQTPEISSREKVKATVPKGIIKPHILMLGVMALVYIATYVQSESLSFGFDGWKRYAVYAAVCVCVYVLPSAIYCIVRKIKPKNVYLRLFSPSVLALSFVSLLLLMSITSLEKYYIAYNFAYRINQAVPFGGSVAQTLLVNAVFPAVFETLFINGVLQSEYSRFGGGITGIVASSLVFAFLHFDLREFVIYFSAGLVLGVLVHVSGSVFPAMLVHFANNAAAIFLSDRMTFIASERIGGTFLMTVLAILCFVFLIIQFQMIEQLCRTKFLKLSKNADKSDMDSGGKDFVGTSESCAESDMPEIRFLCPERATARRFLRLVFSPAMLTALAVLLYANFKN